jgi:tRNA(Arg) A34 adenosine deaminase TadA
MVSTKGAMNPTDDQESPMRLALQIAEIGVAAGQSPFGAAVFSPAGELIVLEHNRVKELLDPTAHAEVNAIRSACKIIGRRDLSGYKIFATCEPCPMCAAAIIFSGIRSVAFGASVDDAKDAGFTELQISSESLFAATEDEVILQRGVLADECRQFLIQNARSTR